MTQSDRAEIEYYREQTEEENSVWMQCYSGTMFHMLDPKPEEMLLIDIAHGLSNICRYNGQCKSFYSVAEHSVWVSHVVPYSLRKAALLHDMSEAWIGDMTRSLKHSMRKYLRVEEKIMMCGAQKFGFDWPLHPLVKEADNTVLANEVPYCVGTQTRKWYLPNPPSPYVNIEFWTPEKARARFLERFWEINE